MYGIVYYSKKLVSCNFCKGPPEREVFLFEID